MRAIQYILKQTGEKDFRLVAEELFDIFPMAVNLDTEGLPYSIKYYKLSALLLKGWQFHETEISNLKKENLEFRMRLEKLESSCRKN